MRDDFFATNDVSAVRRDWDTNQTREYVRSLPIWTGNVEITQLFGGFQNRNYVVVDGDGKRYVARSGFDQGRITQTSVVACTIAAGKLGIGPPMYYVEPNLFVTGFVPGPQLQAEDFLNRHCIEQILDTLRTMHEGSEALPGPAALWEPFHTIRRYLKDLEVGIPYRGVPPSQWAHEVPRWRDITYRLERAIEPYIPVLTHNDVVYVNMMFTSAAREKVWFIDWDGGGYGNPMWDIGELAMWAQADDELDTFILNYYYGNPKADRMKDLMRQHVAFKTLAPLRLIAECLQATIDPVYYLSPEEQAASMRKTNDAADLALETSVLGIVQHLIPVLDQLWDRHQSAYR